MAVFSLRLATKLYPTVITSTIGIKTSHPSRALIKKVTKGKIVKNINVTTQTSSSSSHLFPANNDFTKVEGLIVLANSSSFFSGADGANHPSRAQMTIFPNWLITSLDNQTEEATMRVDVTYFNGSNYKKVICPFHLTAIGCTNTNIDNAEEIVVGQTIANRSLALTRSDEFFKVHLFQGETVSMTLIPPGNGDFWLYVYNSSALWLYSLNSSNSLNPNYNSTSPGDTQKITFTSHSTDWWFIDVKNINGEGFYTLEIVDLP